MKTQQLNKIYIPFQTSGSGSASLTATYIGYGSGANLLTGSNTLYISNSVRVVNTVTANDTYAGINILADANNAARLYRMGTGNTTEIPGTALTYTNIAYFNHRLAGTDGTGKFIIHSDTIGITGSTGSDFGFRSNATGFRIDRLGNIHLANTYPFSVSDQVYVQLNTPAGTNSLTLTNLGTTKTIVISQDATAGNVKASDILRLQSGTSTFMYITSGASFGLRNDANGIKIGTVADIEANANPANAFTVSSKSYFGAANIAATATIHIAAGGELAGTAPLKFTNASSTLGTPERGAMEYSNDTLYITRGSTPVRYFIANYLTTTANLNFPNTNGGTNSDLTVTVTGAIPGDQCFAFPQGVCPANTCITAFCLIADAVTVRFNNYGAGAVDPAADTFTVYVYK